MNKDKTSIDKLRDDNHYYGRFGSHYLSNSKVGVLLSNPSEFLNSKNEQTLPMLHGRYLHTAILEPHKLDTFKFVDASTRNTNIYKNESNGELLMLLKEKDELDLAIDAVRSNKRFYEAIYASGNIYEEPGIGEIFGLMWKGKADIIASDRIIDIKTTSDISKFKYSAKAYNYDSQAYIYGEIFGLPMEFYVVDKSTKQLGIFTCSEDFYESGRAKVAKACEVYNRFFAEGSTDDVTQYYIDGVL
jgi:hypothetical protein